MAIEYSLPRIAIISSYINTNKTLILLYFKNRRSGSSHFHAKMVGKINNAIVSQTCKFCM